MDTILSRAARILESFSLVLVDTSLIIVDFVLDDGIMIGTLHVLQDWQLPLSSELQTMCRLSDWVWLRMLD